jgi:hypothetical protein
MSLSITRGRYLAGITAWMLVFALIVLIAVPCVSSGKSFQTQVVSHIHGAVTETRLTVSFSREGLSFRNVEGYDAVHLEDASYLAEAGKPKLPAITMWIALPAGMTVTGIRVIDVEAEEIPGRYLVVPAQLPRPLTSAVPYDATQKPDAELYASSGTYPAERVKLLRQADLAGQNMAALLVCPVEYIPAEGRLALATRIKVVIEGTQGRKCGDYLPANLRTESRAKYEQVLKGMVVNPQDVELQADFTPRPMGVDPGQYDYVIITPAAMVNGFQVLADWRTRQGRPATIVTTEWIYTSGGYTGTDIEKIRAFVADAHANWGAADFLLGGDSNLIPYHIRSITVPEYWTDDIANDTYFADYDDDWVLEVNIGRAPMRTVSAAKKFKNRIFTYEKSPPLTGYAKTALLLGFDTQACGDVDGETFQEDYIRTPYIPGTWAVDTEYDSEPGTHRGDVIAYLNQGYHLVNHYEHCNTTLMGTGSVCHGDIIATADMDTLTNGDRRSILFPIGCFPADFRTFRCIGEAAIGNRFGGSIAFIGNTCYGWGGPMGDMAHYTCAQNDYFYRNIFDLGMTSLGDNVSLAKNDVYDPYDPYNLHMYCFTQLHLLGDPALTIWTDDPQGLVVTHQQGLLPGDPVTFPVDVSSGGGPVDGATVCLSKDGDVYEVGQTSGGVASFGFTPATEGTLFVTVCHDNCIPYEGYAVVSASASIAHGGSEAPLEFRLASVSPNPFRVMTDIVYAVPSTNGLSSVGVSIYDCRGRHVRTLTDAEMPAGIHHTAWDGKDHRGNAMSSGIYYCEATCGGVSISKQIVLLK